MDIKEVLLQILYIVITGTLPIIASCVAKYIKSVISKNAANIKNEKIRNLINYAGNAVSLAVTTVSQTYVDSLKKSGNFDKKAQITAKQMAIDKARAIISKEMRDAIETVYASFDSYLDSYIEGAVRVNK